MLGVLLTLDIPPVVLHFVPIDLGHLALLIFKDATLRWRIGILSELITCCGSPLATTEAWISCLQDWIELIVVIPIHYYLLWAEVFWDSTCQVRLMLNLGLWVYCIEFAVVLWMSGKCRSMWKCKVIGRLRSCAIKNLLLAENSVMRLHHLIAWWWDATRYYLVTMYLSHVCLNYIGALSNVATLSSWPSSGLDSRINHPLLLLLRSHSASNASMAWEASW